MTAPQNAAKLGVGAPATAAGNPAPQTVVGPISEVRFAVVMYGGVSLAIYIHGVARELFHLVRATAREVSGKAVVDKEKLEGAERVYRKLSHLLGDKKLEDSFPEKPEQTEARKKWCGELDQRLDNAGPVRFIIDLISGTSAGGINGAFLAKALVLGQPIAPLRKLWLEQGDIETLLNDAKSAKGWKELKPPREPESLLNSQRMYLMLLDALRAMNPKTQSPTPATYVEQLDLFLTTTDIRGALLPIRLADRLVFERSYRHDYQFIYGTIKTGSGRNDFEQKNDPFLAFASRCTSSFPFAFEPARWDDVEPLLDEAPTGELWNEWAEKFFRKYLGTTDKAKLKQLSFGDGGYLDNKPFSYVTESLQTRRADLPVDRKLIYVEPSPDHPEGDRTPADKLDVLENVKAALLDLPRQETIREDIERLQERNRLLLRVARIRGYLDHDLARAFEKKARSKSVPSVQDWVEKDLAAMVGELGPSYAAYYRLKVSNATDDLAALITRLFGLDEDSDAFVAVRALVAAWRDKHYSEYKDAAPPGSKSQNQFLLEFNFSYRLRRLQFLLTRLSELEKTDETNRPLLRQAGLDDTSAARLRTHAGQKRREVNTLYYNLRSAYRELRRTLDPDVADSLASFAKKLEFTLKNLAPIITAPDEKARSAAAGKLYESKQKLCDEFTEKIAAQLREIFIASHRACSEKLAPKEDDAEDLRDLKSYLWFYFEHFEEYDQYLYPLVFGTDSEETDPVEILRVSPDDADLLLNERKTGCHKLGGDSFGHFGGFLDRTWRLNDMLWGRLDAVERLLCALLPVPVDQNDTAAMAALPDDLKKRLELRTRLITEAQAAIVAEELGGTRDIPEMPEWDGRRMIVEGFARTKSKLPNDGALRDFVRRLTDPEIVTDPRVRTVLARYLNMPTLLDCYRQALARDRKPILQPLLESVARATSIVGGMLRVLSPKYPLTGKPAGWLLRAGRIGWIFVQLAAPDNLGHFLARHWLKIFYLCTTLVFAAGILFREDRLRYYGLLGLCITSALYLVIDALSCLLCRGWSELNKWRRVLRCVLVTLLVFLLLALIGLAVSGWQHLPKDLEAFWSRLK